MDVAGRKMLCRSLALYLAARPANPGLHLGLARCSIHPPRCRGSATLLQKADPLIQRYRTRLANSFAVCTCSVARLPLNRSLNRLLSFSGGYKEDDRGGGSEGGVVMVLGAGLLLCAAGIEDREREFVIAAKDGDLDALQRLMEGGVDVNSRHPLGWNAVHSAVINRQHGVVEFLLRKGADVNAEDEFSSARRMASRLRISPARVAAVRDHEFSSYINHFVSYSGFTPLHYAVISDDIAIIRLLLSHGADPTVEDRRGLTPVDYCTNEDVRILLKDHAAQVESRRLEAQLEERKRFPLEQRLRERIVGQDGAITTTAAAIRRRELGWADDDHPLVFLFLGSSGIGKTELAKQIAHYMHKDNSKGFIRLDMSEYQEKHEVAKLIGSPPGYVGHDQGGQLTERLRECPAAVVLFDEVDKAHPDVLTTLLQLFDEGRLTDGQGKTVHCKQAIFVMTSNLASDEIASHALQLRREAAQAAQDYHHSQTEPEEHIEISRDFKERVVEPILKSHFKRDEFLGRINEMVYFLPFSRSELNQLVEKELRTWQTRRMQIYR
ncbi:Caseinolytic peptidase B protein homolog [Geodia barretti]|uniref:Caseinolytic peptidase B protein homolog n=2 Tax=Geodia barretti TaxID=519541 RepID=A0AA35X053_GEOBA|nr:Caseinolytic peptidase B protein homolog [Geodia barretti]